MIEKSNPTRELNRNFRALTLTYLNGTQKPSKVTPLQRDRNELKLEDDDKTPNSINGAAAKNLLFFQVTIKKSVTFFRIFYLDKNTDV